MSGEDTFVRDLQDGCPKVLRNELIHFSVCGGFVTPEEKVVDEDEGGSGRSCRSGLAHVREATAKASIILLQRRQRLGIDV